MPADDAACRKRSTESAVAPWPPARVVKLPASTPEAARPTRRIGAGVRSRTGERGYAALRDAGCETASLAKCSAYNRPMAMP